MTSPEDRDNTDAPLLGLSAALEAALADAEDHARAKHGEAPTETGAPDGDEDDPGDLFAGMGAESDDEDDEPTRPLKPIKSPPIRGFSYDDARRGEGGHGRLRTASIASPHGPATEPEDEEVSGEQTAKILHEAKRRAKTLASGGELELLRTQVKHLRDRLKDEDTRASRAERQLEVVTNDLKQTRKRFAAVAEREDELNSTIERQKNELPKQTRTEVFSALLPAVDSTDLLTKNLLGDDSLSTDARRAVEILKNDWDRALAKLQIQPFDAVGQKFDPVVHDAISEVESTEIPPGICIRQVGRGYLMEHRLLRSAMVVVSKAPEPDDDGQ